MIVRRGAASDELAAFEVMRRATHSEADWSHHASIRRHLQTCSQSSFWVAEEAVRFGSPRIVGYARAIVRDRVWTLTEFNVLPDHHRKGIGRALLSACLEEGDGMDADYRFILASQHPDADSLYVRLCGCIPRLPMLLMSGKSETLVIDAATQIDDAVLNRRTLGAPAEQYAQAETFLEQAIVAAPEYEKGHYYLGLTMARLGRKEDSERELALATKLADEANKKARSGLRLNTPDVQPPNAQP